MYLGNASCGPRVPRRSSGAYEKRTGIKYAVVYRTRDAGFAFDGETRALPTEKRTGEAGIQQILLEEQGDHPVASDFRQGLTGSQRDEEEAVAVVEVAFQHDGRASRHPYLGAVPPSTAKRASEGATRRTRQISEEPAGRESPPRLVFSSSSSLT
jgi:hypothetical protein